MTIHVQGITNIIFIGAKTVNTQAHTEKDMTTKKKAFVKVGSKRSGVSKKQIDGVSEIGAPAYEALKTDTVS
jgi:hypothetical protein